MSIYELTNENFDKGLPHVPKNIGQNCAILYKLDGCHWCEDELIVLKKLNKEIGFMTFYTYTVNSTPENEAHWNKIKNTLKNKELDEGFPIIMLYSTSGKVVDYVGFQDYGELKANIMKFVQDTPLKKNKAIDSNEKPKFLLLCHGKKYSLYGQNNPGDCTTMGFPFSIETFINTTTVDRSKKVGADVVADWTKKTKLPANSFDVVTTGCCFWAVFIKENGILQSNAFNNVLKVLKTGGYFTIDFSLVVYLAFSKYVFDNWDSFGNPPDYDLLAELTDGDFFYDDSKLDMLEENGSLKKQLKEMLFDHISHEYPQLKRIKSKRDIKNFLTFVAKDNIGKSEFKTLMENFPLDNSGEEYFNGAIYQKSLT